MFSHSEQSFFLGFLSCPPLLLKQQPVSLLSAFIVPTLNACVYSAWLVVRCCSTVQLKRALFTHDDEADTLIQVNRI